MDHLGYCLNCRTGVRHCPRTSQRNFVFRNVDEAIEQRTELGTSRFRIQDE